MADNRPIIVLGAARSGTKFLRSVIASSLSVAASPYDVNYVWRYGNEHYPHDALPAAGATDRVCRFIRRQVHRSAGIKPGDGRRVVEKTVSNALRVPFVYQVFPDARFVYLQRDGRDVTESAIRCWHEPPKLGYLRHKLATYPWLHCGPYAAKHLVRVAGRMAGVTEASRSWGPRYPGLDADLLAHGLTYVCARQWQTCVEQYEFDRMDLPKTSLLELRYEDLARNPGETAHQLAQWLELPDAEEVANYAQRKASASSIGRGSELPDAERRLVSKLLCPTLERWGYSAPATRRVA